MGSIKLGRIFDIDIHVHPSFGLVFLWALFQWGIGPGGSLFSFSIGMVFVLAMFASVVIHEFAHAAMAQHYGNRVLDVILWPFGGVARIEQMPATPKAELAIALAGPATNLAIFVLLLPFVVLLIVLGGWQSLFPEAGFLERMTLSGLLGAIAFTNLLVMVFNLLPAFPVDGGRVLRAMLTPRLGRDRATSVCVWVGIALAALMFLVGLWLQSWILLVMGVVVIIGANAEGRSIRVESAMRRLTVGQFALWDAGGVAPGEPLAFALRGGPRDLVVTDRGRVVGVLWRHQLLGGLNGGVAGRTVGDVMDRDVYVADISDSVYDVQRQMNATNTWAIPVTEHGIYRGIFTADRFVNVYRQIAPGFFSNRLTIPDEWREAIAESLRGAGRRR